MLRATRWWTGLLTIGAMLVVVAGNAPAQPKKPSEKHDAAALSNTLRDVINVGAKMFNDEGDYVGCYRLFQGSLLTVRPFLAPDMQKSIDAGLMTAEKMNSYADRALELRRVLDEIRAKTKAAEAVAAKKEEKKKDEGSKIQEPTGTGMVAGKLIFEGKPVQEGVYVTLISATGKTFSSRVQKDGTFQFKTAIPAGEYRVAIELPDIKLKGPMLPARYNSADSSGLLIRVQAGKQQVDLNLVK